MGTVIEFGGGPTVGQRSDLTRHKYGTQISGYTGKLPLVKFSSGHTFGETTHQLACRYDLKHPIAGYRDELEFALPEDGLPLQSSNAGVTKYLENMIPGYAGHIPRQQYVSIARPFTISSNLGLRDHLVIVRKRQETDERGRRTRQSLPTLQVTNSEADVKQVLNCYAGINADDRKSISLRRSPLEAPVCSFAGFVPRKNSTDESLGCCYQEACEKALRRLQHETCHHLEILQRPVQINKSASSVPKKEMNFRLFPKKGMIPKYRGHVQDSLNHTGETFGNMTRLCECCSHGFPNFGSYQKYEMTKRPYQPIIS